MRKVPMQLAEVLETNCEPAEAQKAQFEEVIGTGYGTHMRAVSAYRAYMLARLWSTFSEKLAMTFCFRWSPAAK